MEGSSVDWLPGVVALALGLAAGLVLALRVRAARGARLEAVPVEVRDLEGKRDVLLHQLQELEDMAGKQTPAHLAEERYRLELEAAGVLMALDRRAAAQAAPKGKKKPQRDEAPASPPPAGWLAQSPALRGFLWGAGAMLVLGGLLFSVRETATARPEGGSPTGAPMGGRPAAGPETAAASEEEAQLRARVESHPDDLDARLSLAQLDLGKGDMMGVWNETKAILDREPGHPRAIAYQALVRLAMGQGDVARSMLEKLLADSPDLLEGYLHLALVQLRTGHPQDAEAVMARAEKRFPERADTLKRLLAQMREQAAAEGEAPVAGEGDPHAGLGMPEAAPVAKPAAPEPASASASVPAGKSVEGVLELDASLQHALAPGAVVYVIAREAGGSGGPPAAVKRLPASFPLRFQLSAADSMMGGELPAKLKIEARVDSDGDAMTHDASDPSAALDGVALGTRDLRLVLRR